MNLADQAPDSLRRPGAWIPVAMSLAALLVVVVHIAIFGTAREPDEGPAAHIWQLLMAGQVPVMIVHAVKWLPRIPKQAMQTLAVQVLAVLAAIAPVYWLGL